MRIVQKVLWGTAAGFLFFALFFLGTTKLAYAEEFTTCLSAKVDILGKEINIPANTSNNISVTINAIRPDPNVSPTFTIGDKTYNYGETVPVPKPPHPSGTCSSSKATFRAIQPGNTVLSFDLRWDGFIVGNTTITKNSYSDDDRSGLITKPVCFGLCYIDIVAPLVNPQTLARRIKSSLPFSASPTEFALPIGTAGKHSFAVTSSINAVDIVVPGSEGLLILGAGRRLTNPEGEDEDEDEIYSYRHAIEVTAPCPYMFSNNEAVKIDRGWKKYSEGVPFYASGDSCSGTFVLNRDITFDVYFNEENAGSVTYEDSLSVGVRTSDQYTTLSVNYYDQNGSPILSSGTPVSGSATISLNTPSTIHGFDPVVTIDQDSFRGATANPALIKNFYPATYDIAFPIPAGYTNIYITSDPNTGDTATVTVPISKDNIDLTRHQVVDFFLCPDGAAAGTCVPRSTLDEIVAPPPVDTSDNDIPPQPDLCIPEEMLNFSMGWFYKHIVESLCMIVDISVESVFPLLDVNIPLLTTIDDEVGLERRLMFTTHIADTSSTGAGPITGVGGFLASAFSNTYTPTAVYELWQVAYNIARVAVVIALVFYSFMIIYRVDVNKYSLRQFITNALFAILLSSFSYQIATFMFDINKIAALVVNDTMASIFAEQSSNIMSFSGWTTSLLNGLAGLGLGAVVVVGAGQILGGMTLLLPCLGCMLSYALSILTVWVVMFARALFLYIMVAVSPIVFMLRIIPEFKGMTGAWFKNMVRILTVYPLLVLIYNLLTVVGTLFGN